MSKKSNKCKRIVYDHTLRYVSKDEQVKRGIKSKGIGVWECTKCGAIVHSM